MEQFLSSLYNFKLKSLEEFYKNEGKETIEINILSKVIKIFLNLSFNHRRFI